MLQEIEKFVDALKDNETIEVIEGLEEMFNEQENREIIKHKSEEWSERLKALAGRVLLLSEAIDDESIPTKYITEIYIEDEVFRDDSELNSILTNIECSVDIALAKLGLKVSEDKCTCCNRRWDCTLFTDAVESDVFDYTERKLTLIDKMDHIPSHCENFDNKEDTCYMNSDTKFEEDFNSLFEETEGDDVDDNNSDWLMYNLLGNTIDFLKDFDKEWKILYSKYNGSMTPVGERILKMLDKHIPLFIDSVYIDFINNNQTIDTYKYEFNHTCDNYNTEKLSSLRNLIDALLYSGNFNLKVRVTIIEKYLSYKYIDDLDAIETETEVKKFKVYIKK